MNREVIICVVVVLLFIFGSTWGLFVLGENSKRNNFNRQATIVQIVCPSNPDSALCIQALERISR